jgi:hypothetical protein
MAMMLRTARMHPALHVDSERIVIGRVTDDGSDYQLIDSDRRIYTPDDIKDELLFMPRPYADLAGRWPGDDVTTFLATGEAPTFCEILALAMAGFDEAMEFARSEQRTLLATWAVATYFHQCFLTFSRLNFSGEKGSGKSYPAPRHRLERDVSDQPHAGRALPPHPSLQADHAPGRGRRPGHRGRP